MEEVCGISVEVHRGSVPRLPAGDGWLSTPFQSAQWLEAWVTAFGAEPVTVTGKIGGSAAFILPLMLKRKMGVKVLTPLAVQHSDYGAPLLNADHAAALARADGAELLRAIARRLGGVDLVHLAKQPRMLGGVANPFVLAEAFDYHAGAHAIRFKPGETYDDFMFNRRSSKTRRRLREKRAALEKAGPITFRLAEDKAEARGLISSCLVAKSAQLKKLGSFDPFAVPENRDFLIDYFSGDTGQTTWAAALDVGGKTAVTSFGFRTGGDWLLYQMAMEEGADARNSPGTHHLTELIRHCTETGAALLDLSLGDESYKSEWCCTHSRLAISVLPLTAKGWALGKLIAAQGRAQLRMASDPQLYERAKRMKGLMQVLRLAA